MKKLGLIIALCSLVACAKAAQHVFLAEPNKQVPTTQQFLPAGISEFNFNSAKSVKEKSIVEVGGWHIIFDEEIQAFRFDIKITNTSDTPGTTPEELVIIDADRKSLRLLKPDEYVHYIEGITPEEAMAKSEAASAYTVLLRGTHDFAGHAYGYRTFYSHYFPWYGPTYPWYGPYYPAYTPSSTYTIGFARGYALGLETKASKINKQVKDAELTALKPVLTVAQASNTGRVYSLAGKLPLEIHVFACEDHHVIQLQRHHLGYKTAEEEVPTYDQVKPGYNGSAY